MNKSKIAYWVATGLLSLMYFGGAAFYLSSRTMVEQVYVGLGYPTYLISLLIVAKVLAPIAILSRARVWLSDLAYAGMFYHLLLAASAHINAGDYGFPPAIVGLVALGVSFALQNRARGGDAPYALSA